MHCVLVAGVDDVCVDTRSTLSWLSQYCACVPGGCVLLDVPHSLANRNVFANPANSTFGFRLDQDADGVGRYGDVLPGNLCGLCSLYADWLDAARQTRFPIEPVKRWRIALGHLHELRQSFAMGH